MNSAQSPHIPAKGEKPGIGDLGWLAAYSARGLAELVRARAIFAKLEAREIPQRNRKSKAAARGVADPVALARIGYVLPRISDRLPWRSDCLIQAIAAQNWLSSQGAASEIQIGVENPKNGEFGAHAWLMADDTVVTGGEIERYHVLLADSGELSNSGPQGPSERPD